jgi:hypothetical protein
MERKEENEVPFLVSNVLFVDISQKHTDKGLK